MIVEKRKMNRKNYYWYNENLKNVILKYESCLEFCFTKFFSKNKIIQNYG